jgi:hypothetical protein
MADKYNTQLDKQIIDRYKREVKDGELDLGEVALWAIQNNLWKEPIEDQVEKLRKQLATAMRSKTFTDPRGRKVRQNYCVRREGVHPDGRKYLQTLWTLLRLTLPTSCNPPTMFPKTSKVWRARASSPIVSEPLVPLS